MENVRDIVGLYLDPPLKAMVLCVDEESQIQALDRTQPVWPLVPGIPDPPAAVNRTSELTQLCRFQPVSSTVRRL